MAETSKSDKNAAIKCIAIIGFHFPLNDGERDSSVSS